MSRLYGDPVDVWAVEQRPVRFVWRGRLYTVRGVLEHWVATRDWWREGDAPDGAEAVARDFWRVEATPDTEVGVYELRYDQADQAWLLSRAWD